MEMNVGDDVRVESGLVEWDENGRKGLVPDDKGIWPCWQCNGRKVYIRNWCCSGCYEEDILCDECKGTGIQNMSYVRWSDDSDLYIFDDMSGGITCCACLLSDGGRKLRDFNVATQGEMIAHVEEHIARGHDVPNYVIRGLRAALRMEA